MVKPKSLQIRMYQVGFGDAFLLTFKYPNATKHVLIDCGSNAKHGYDIADVAKDIAATCKDDPVALVVTHRHKDHISGFGGDAWKAMKKLEVARVIQPWTEDPALAHDALGPAVAPSAAAAAVASLANLQEVVADIARLAARMPDCPLKADLVVLAANNIKNPEIVKNLGTYADRTAYVHCGFDDAFDGFLPGVKVHVLGPPTREHTSFAYAKDSNDYWPLAARGGYRRGGYDEAAGPPLAVHDEVPIWGKWVRRRLDLLCERRWLEIVTAVDSALNNTSVILLFEVGKERLLFPGDAQLENWRYAIEKYPGAKDLLAKVTWYKVGHHGSHNATPKSMWNALLKRGDGLSALLSTHHNHAYPDVPRQSLLHALQTETHLHSTEHADKLRVDIDEIAL
jgi:beta-lactamase superfamily II metal-dependent hydrolase